MEDLKSKVKPELSEMKQEESVPLEKSEVKTDDKILSAEDQVDKTLKPVPLLLNVETGNKLGNKSFVPPIETGLADLLRLVKESKINERVGMVRFSREYYHFYNIEKLYLTSSNKAKPLYIEDGAESIDAKSFSTYATSKYISPISYAGMLGIKFNDWDFPFSISQLDQSLISNVAAAYSGIESNVINLPGSGIGSDVTDHENITSLMSSLMYVLCGCIVSYGNRFLLGSESNGINEKCFTTLLGNEFTELMTDSTEFKLDNKELFIGRLDVAAASNEIFEFTNGYIHVIDPEYQHNLTLLAMTFPNDVVRARLLRAFDAVRPYGEQPSTTRTISAIKTQSTVITDTDIVANTLTVNYSTMLQRHRILPDEFLSLINSLCMQRSHFENGDETTEFMFISYETVLGEMAALPNFSFFPYSEPYIMSFEYARKVPPIIAGEFAMIYEQVKSMLSLYPFMLLGESTKQLAAPQLTSQFPAIASMLSTLSSITTDFSPEMLSKFVVYDLMSPYVDIPTPSTQFLDGKTRPQFAMDLLGLVLEKILFPNLYVRNKHLYISKCHEFYRLYFTREYNALFKLHGYGSIDVDGVKQDLRNISGVSKKLIGIVDWTVDRDGRTLGVQGLFYKVWNYLKLNNNPLSYTMDVESGYRVRNRLVRLPGKCYIPVDKSMSYPLTDFLYLALDYSSSYNPLAASLPKIMGLAYDKILEFYTYAITSVGAWFHCIYCPIYLNASLHPVLTIPDDESLLPYDKYFAYYDDIKNHDPTFRTSVPHRNPVDITLPGVNGIIFGTELSKQIKRVLIVARLPTARYQGMSVVDINVDNYNVYSVLYSSPNVKQSIQDYMTQLIRRQQAVEVEKLIGRVSISDIPLPENIRDAIARANQLGGVTAASFARLRACLSKESYNSFNVLAMTSIGGNLVDPRIYRPVLCTCTWNFETNLVLTITNNCVRNHVLQNFELIVDRMYGRAYGIKKLNIGISLSSMPISGLNFLSVHKRSLVRVTISESQQTNILRNLNTTSGYLVKIEFNGNVHTQVIQNPNVIRNLFDTVGAYGYHIYEITITKRFIMTNGVDFLTKCLNDGASVIVIPDLMILPYYTMTNSMDADQVEMINKNDVSRCVAHTTIALMSVQQTSVQQETFSSIKNEVVRHMLPTRPEMPIFVYQDFHINSRAAIDTAFVPVVVPRLQEVGYDTIQLDGYVQSSIDYTPCALLSSSIVYRVTPVVGIPVLKKTC